MGARRGARAVLVDGGRGDRAQRVTADAPQESLVLKSPLRGVIAAALVASACESTVTSSAQDGAAPAQDVVTAPPEDAAVEADVPAEDAAAPADVPAASGIGGACSASGFPQQGNCPRGQICIPSNLSGGAWPGGYCTQLCNFGSRCPADAVCESVQGFPACLKRCSGNDDCRSMEGYICAPTATAGTRVCRINDEPVGAREDGSACFTRGGGAHPAPALARNVFQGANVNVSGARGDSDLEAEGNVAVNPMSGAIAVSYIALQGGFGGTDSFMGVSRSTNGAMWTGDGAVRDPEFNGTSDPVLAYSPDGVLHMTFIGLNRTGGSVGAVRVRVTESTDDGRTWARARQVDPPGYCAGGAGGVCDKPWIVVGPSTTEGATSLYLAYLRASRTAVGLVAHRSDDNGMTWAAPVSLGNVSGTATSSNQPNLATIATGPRGEVAFAWVTVNNSLVDGRVVSGRLGSTENRIYLRRSPDGLRTMPSAVVVSRNTDAVVYVQPQVAIDGETIHVAYVAGSTNAAWDIILATSGDSGRTWRHRKVNDDPEACASHHWPQLVVDPVTHSAHLIWLENRFGEGQVAYARCPNDPAMPCGANELVSDAMGAFRFTTSRQPNVWHGDYIGLTLSADGNLWANWSDTRTGSPAMYVARGRARP